MSDTLHVVETLRQLEEKLLDSDARKDAKWVAATLTEEFLEFGASGRTYSKTEVIAMLKAETSERIAMGDFQARMLADGIALVTYRAWSGGDALRESLRSSLWIFRDGRWQMLFHQGTRTGERSNHGGDESAHRVHDAKDEVALRDGAHHE